MAWHDFFKAIRGGSRPAGKGSAEFLSAAGVKPKAPAQRAADLRKRTADLLAGVEGELRRADAADERIGQQAREWEAKLVAELAARRKKLKATGNDPDAEAEYLWLAGQLRRARIAAGLSETGGRR